MADKSLGESQEWVVTGMDCASCAMKIRTAVERLPGVSDVNVAVMAEKLTLRLEPGTTPRDKIEAAVVKLGFGIGATKAAKAKAFVLPKAKVETPAHDDHAGHDHPNAKANVVTADEGHGAPGHLHDDPADKGKAWFQTGKGRLVIGTGLLLAAAWALKLLASEDIANWAFIAACVIGVAPVARRAFAVLQAGMPFTIEMLMTNIRQNVTLALGLKAVFLVTTVFGMTGLWIAILADTGATVLVTLNALRLLRFNPEREG